MKELFKWQGCSPQFVKMPPARVGVGYLYAGQSFQYISLGLLILTRILFCKADDSVPGIFDSGKPFGVVGLITLSSPSFEFSRNTQS